MLRIEKAGGHKEYMESRRLMWAHARQTKISYFHLLCYEKNLYAIYDEEVFCGCAVQGALKGSAFVLCLFSEAAYCAEAHRARITELLREALQTDLAFINFAQVAEPTCSAFLQPLRQT